VNFTFLVAHPRCVGYEFYRPNGRCFVLGPGLAQAAEPPWEGASQGCPRLRKRGGGGGSRDHLKPG
jgi:hypothetical protein